IADRPTIDSILDTLASLAGMNRAAMAEGPAGSGNEVVASAPVQAPAIGDLAPDFRLPTAGGQTVSLGDYLGEQNVVVVFFRAWW
ncbi:MAG: redoxin domain-containing protein, partial [Chloroflexi bacterium]|nr:redoxin domain-containing protein [Chloroflexota bacterium]